jgi:PAS domain S-box-containing protein
VALALTFSKASADLVLLATVALTVLVVWRLLAQSQRNVGILQLAYEVPAHFLIAYACQDIDKSAGLFDCTLLYRGVTCSAFRFGVVAPLFIMVCPAAMGWQPWTDWGDVAITHVIPQSILSVVIAALAQALEEYEQALLERDRLSRDKDRLLGDLRGSEGRFRALVQGSPDVIMLIHDDGTILFVNPSVEALLGQTAEAVQGTPFRRWIHSDDIMELEQVLSRTPAAASGLTVSCRVTDGKGMWRDVEVRVYRPPARLAEIGPLFSGEEALCILRDVTDRRRAENALRETETKLRQSQKLEAVGMLASGIAHDFNNLLGVMMANTQLMAGTQPQNLLVRDGIEQIEAAAHHAAALTKQLLAFSRKQIVQPRVVNLTSVVSDVAKMLRRVIGEHIELRVLERASCANARVDPSQVEQVLLNLAVNARDAMPNGGRLILETGVDDLPEEGERPAGKYAVLSVQDTGVGMDASVQEHIFEPFFTTKPKEKGSGLGLATVYGIVRQSGGCLTVESTPGQGSTFTVFFPWCDQPADSAESRPRRLAKTTGPGTVMVVEDEEALRVVIVKALALQGYHVLAAADGVEALQVLESAGTVDLVLTDIVMPRFNGVEFGKRLQDAHPDLPVVYMTGYAEPGLVPRGSNMSVLKKPFGLDELLHSVEDLLSRHREETRAALPVPPVA